jgi:hypothetical protein
MTVGIDQKHEEGIDVSQEPMEPSQEPMEPSQEPKTARGNGELIQESGRLALVLSDPGKLLCINQKLFYL